MNFKRLNIKNITAIGLAVLGTNCALAQEQIFFDGFEGSIDRAWAQVEPATHSSVSFEGENSVRIQSGGSITRTFDVAQNTDYTIRVMVRGGGRLRVRWDGLNRSTRVTNPSNNWVERSVSFNSGSAETADISFEYNSTSGRFDNFSIIDETPEPDFGLNPNAQPWDNFDLKYWGLDSPALRDTSAVSGTSNFERGVRVDDFEFVALNEGENNSNYESASALFFGDDDNVESSTPYFYTANDGGMVFKSPVNGGRTSTGTRFPRSELREYARGGITRRSNGETISTSGLNENNWVLGYQPSNLILDDNQRAENISNVGGRNARLAATLRMNKVTETGRPDDIGSVIIGQIHAEEDEPLRLYYRKLPGNELGSIYVLHEIREGDDLDEFILVGSRDDDAQNPEGGIALDELFSYEIENRGAILEVTLRRGDIDGDIINTITIDMEAENSGYDLRDEWMYFKAGLYTQNNVAIENFNGVPTPGAAISGFGDDGTEADFDQATFYRLTVEHDENNCDDCTNIVVE